MVTVPSAWYAVHTRSRYEKVVDRLLSEKGLETFLPLTTRRSRLSLSRFREAQVPLFSGYVFCRLSSSVGDFHCVRSTTGVARIVGTREGPASIPDQEIESLRKLLARDVPFVPGCSLASGRQVIVGRGPLAGIRGKIVRRKNRKTFVVKVQLIQRMLQVDLDALDLEIVAPRN